MTSDAFKYESLQDSETILAHLTALRDGFAQGCLRLRTDKQELVLEPKGLITFDLEAKRKHGRRKVTIRLEWKDQPDQAIDDDFFVIEPHS